MSDSEMQVFDSWTKLFEAHGEELLLYKALYKWLAREVREKHGVLDGLTHLAQEIDAFLDDVAADVGYRPASRCALAHMAVNSTLGNIMGCHEDGCFLDFEGKNSVRKFLISLAVKYGLFKSIFIFY